MLRRKSMQYKEMYEMMAKSAYDEWCIWKTANNPKLYTNKANKAQKKLNKYLDILDYIRKGC